MEIDVSKIIDYDEEVEKVRLVSIRDNKILICNYDGYYMLPGGKIDAGETKTQAIRREILEETGHNLSNVEEYLITNNYADNYTSRKGNNPRNRKIKTTYFKTDEEVTLDKPKKLTDNENNGVFVVEYMDIGELVNMLETIPQTKKQRVFSKEVLTVINYYLKNYKLVDLHTHTTASDGQYTPQEVVNQAVDNNIKTIAITDHDTILGLDKINYNDPRIQIIPGIEITVKRETGRMHIVGLDIDYKNKNLLEFLSMIKEYNRHNLRNIIDYLKENDIHLDDKDIENIFKKETNIGRPDIAKLLIKEGYVESVQEAFDKYLIEAFLKTRHKNFGYTYKDVLDIINEANGISVLAHPNSLDLPNDKFEELIEEMVDNNLQGIEVYHPNITQEEREYYMSIAARYNLLISGGTDYHGEKVKPETKIGLGKDNIYLEDLPIMKTLNNRTS